MSAASFKVRCCSALFTAVTGEKAIFLVKSANEFAVFNLHLHFYLFRPKPKTILIFTLKKLSCKRELVDAKRIMNYKNLKI